MYRYQNYGKGAYIMSELKANFETTVWSAVLIIFLTAWGLS